MNNVFAQRALGMQPLAGGGAGGPARAMPIGMQPQMPLQPQAPMAPAGPVGMGFNRAPAAPMPAMPYQNFAQSPQAQNFMAQRLAMMR